MVKRLVSLYKVPLLISLTLAIVLIAIRVETKPYPIILLLVGIALGTFFLDLDYFIYAFFLEPTADFSKTLVGYLKHKDIKNALLYISHHKDEIADKTLNSALFQIVLAGISLLVVSSNNSYLVKGLVLSAFVNSLYRFAEYYFEGKADQWFWVLKTKPNKQTIQLYILGLIVALVLSIRMF